MGRHPPSPYNRSPQTTAGGLPKKGTGARTWLVIDRTGEGQMVEAGKHAIMRRTGLSTRDLRVLDPLLSYPSTVFGRERAILVNLEHIKAIVMAEEVLLLDARDASVKPFVEELQKRLSSHHQATKSKGGHVVCVDNVSNLENNPYLTHSRNYQNKHQRGYVEAENIRPKFLPFEFVALETCLETVCISLENETKTLEKEVQTALDKLTSKVSTQNLERVRDIKSRLVGIFGRVQKVRDELERLLDDDEDMAEMYLTEKMADHKLESSSAFLNERDERESAGSNTGKHLDVQELEMLLEPYFGQIDGTLNNLTAIKEHVNNTEDYINILLDEKQNQLLRMGVKFTTATMVTTAGMIVTGGVMGMNIHIDIFDQVPSNEPRWYYTVGGVTIGALIIYFAAVRIYKYLRLID